MFKYILTLIVITGVIRNAKAQSHLGYEWLVGYLDSYIVSTKAPGGFDYHRKFDSTGKLYFMAHGCSNICDSRERYNFELYDMLGKCVLKLDIQASKQGVTIKLPLLAPGTYVYKCSRAGAPSSMGKLIID